MRRTGNLYERIHDWDNLLRAFHNASRGKRSRSDVVLYARDLDENLLRLQRQLRERNVAVGDYRYFTVYEPKERLICAASFRERVLHHAIMNVLEPVLDRFQIHDSYACRRGKGTVAALDRAAAFARRYAVFAKLDVRKYFDSVPHDRLMELLRRRLKDRSLLDLVERILASYERRPGRGIPIGNLTSQHLANFYLAHGDHLVKDRLRLPGYVRYMDDMILFHHSREQLRRVRQEVERYVERDLLMQLKPPVTGRTAAGVPFLGFLLTPAGILLTRRKRLAAVHRVTAAAHELAFGKWTEGEYAGRLLPVFAHLSLARSLPFRQNLMKRWDLGLEPRETGR